MLSRENFLTLLTEIDRVISASDLLFHQRPLHAFDRLADKVDPKGRFDMVIEDHTDENDFSNNALFTQVHRWYESRYGDRIKTNMGPGSYILVIKNEPWEVELPLCYGQINFTINDNLNKTEAYLITGDGSKIPNINILWHVKDITQEIASSLTDTEREGLLKEYMFGLNAVQSLRGLSKVEFMTQAMNDYDVAVSNIFHKYPDYNNSKWASLQFAEKTMKAKLTLEGIPFDKIHDLSKLANKLKPVGLNIPPPILSNIQCKAGVRYGQETVKKNEAILALQSALALFSDVFEASSFEYES